ncbi:transglutaminase-like domain-containing protein [Pseudodesulfovibrio piezophilus]|uniref:Transglutaminase-like domain-containing protein n=1 Tax=Pseudodesulfovibrio piezophilus (strain DSM 21447 / JCM 15486 / C1TLV30) TaxID=1322246 RepID=M1WSH3_PSEP2|nr:transglutaminase-like domain-containing protein [Pseudodesulfovibrio piezophilus]CCH50199.1 conserved exported protein of unknown function [Pseudodesulfovibrio piezophilus C1TLV30]
MKNLTKIVLRTLAVVMMTTYSVAAFAAQHSGVVKYTVKPTVTSETKTVNVWIPYPLSNDAQKITDLKVDGNFATSSVYRDEKSGAMFLYAGWPAVAGQPELTMSFHADLSSRKVASIKESNLPIPAPIKEEYLKSTLEIPVKAFTEQAQKVVAGKKTILEKARAIYDWTVDNTVRDPNVTGCGLAKPGRTLYECEGGGKCADISAVFVTMARAAGVPARDVYGLRLGSPKTGDVTSGYHCWAEFYLPGTGWVPADPADVRKMMLVHDLKMGDKAVEEWREFFWGGDDLFRVTLNKGARGVVLTPAQQGAPINYMMYPYAEVDGKPLNYFDSSAFTYSVNYTAD